MCDELSEKWVLCFHRCDRLLREVTICLVGKYTRLEDSYTSVVKALHHAAMACNHKLDLKVSFSKTACYIFWLLHSFICYNWLLRKASCVFAQVPRSNQQSVTCLLNNVTLPFWLPAALKRCFVWILKKLFESCGFILRKAMFLLCQLAGGILMLILR